MSAVSAERAGAIDLELAGLRLRAGGTARGRDLFGALDLRIAGGERWVVIGPNGAGKSSLLAAIAGVFPLAAGQVRLDGRAIAAWPADALRPAYDGLEARLHVLLRSFLAAPS